MLSLLYQLEYQTMLELTCLSSERLSNLEILIGNESYNLVNADPSDRSPITHCSLVFFYNLLA